LQRFSTNRSNCLGFVPRLIGIPVASFRFGLVPRGLPFFSQPLVDPLASLGVHSCLGSRYAPGTPSRLYWVLHFF
jgi:hypothetical protein